MVDYSKWKKIDVSDDEDETHPNIDTPSLFRMRHRRRLERMEEIRAEKKELDAKSKSIKKKIADLTDEIELSNGTIEEDTQDQLKVLVAEEEAVSTQILEVLKMEELQGWNVDTISKDGFSHTFLNKTDPPPSPALEELTEEEKEQRFLEFVKDNKELLKHYGMQTSFDENRRFLMEYPGLVCKYSTHFLFAWCVDLQIEKDHEQMDRVCRQCVCLEFILELANHMKIDPRGCIDFFFKRLQIPNQSYQLNFATEYKSIKERIIACAESQIKEEEEERLKAREKRTGPGGLDPVDVFDSLPDDLKMCFASRDTELLQKTVAEMPDEAAQYHIKRCVDSGLWVPDSSVMPSGDTATAPTP